MPSWPAQLTLMSFALMLVVALQCMVTSSIPRHFERQRRLQAVRDAASMFDGMQVTQRSSSGRLAALLKSDGSGGNAKATDGDNHKPLQAPSATLICVPERDPEAGDQEAAHDQDRKWDHSSQSEAEMQRSQLHASPNSVPGAHGDASGPGCSEQPSLNKMFVRFSRPFVESSAQGDGTMQKAKVVILSGLREMKETREKLRRDEAYAILVAQKVDMWSCWILLFLFLAVTVILIVLASAIGDHKLMLVGQTMPGNA
eukprot:358421-Chlamydomonas_euryale.AAC.4